MASEQSDEVFTESSTSKRHRLVSSSPRLMNNKQHQESPCKKKDQSFKIHFSFLELADQLSPLLNQIKSSSFSTQEPGEKERSKGPLLRRPSVLDEKALREADTTVVRHQRIQAISRSYQGILESIGEDPTRQGL